MIKNKRDELFENNINLAHKFMHSNYSKSMFNIEPEDYKQICYMGLLKACNTYKETSGALSTYAYRLMEQAIYMELRKIKRRVKETSFELVLNEGNGTNLHDILSDSNANVYECIENKLELEQAKLVINNIEGKDKKIFLEFLQGKKQNEIAKNMGISQANVSRRIKFIISKLKKQVNK